MDQAADLGVSQLVEYHSGATLQEPNKGVPVSLNRPANHSADENWPIRGIQLVATVRPLCPRGWWQKPAR